MHTPHPIGLPGGRAGRRALEQLAYHLSQECFLPGKCIEIREAPTGSVYLNVWAPAGPTGRRMLAARIRLATHDGQIGAQPAVYDYDFRYSERVAEEIRRAQRELLAVDWFGVCNALGAAYTPGALATTGECEAAARWAVIAVRDSLRREPPEDPGPAVLPKTHSAPPCCVPSPNAGLAERVYCAYNAAGDPATVGRNARGEPCPTWDALRTSARSGRVRS